MKYKQNRKSIICNCDYCQIEFQKPESEYKRNLKLGRKNYCSLNCSGHAHSKFIIGKSDYDISQHAKNKIDEYTPFRRILNQCKYRFKEFTITLNDLKEQWDKQQGICPYSGIQLILPKKSKNHPYLTVSIDRINSSNGYVTGNIQFTSIAINYMKSTMKHEETIELCQLITNYYNKLKN